MQVLNFSVSNQILTAACPGRLVVAQTRGHLFAQFALDQEWDGLSVTAVFSNDFARKSYQRILTADPVEVPEEVLVPGRLFVSLVGLGDGGAVRLTTKRMDKPIVVYRAGDLVGLTPEETTPELWEQAMSAIGRLDELQTSDKSSLVAAINAVFQSGGGGSVDPDAIAQAVADYMAAHPIQETDPTVPAWAKQPEKPSYTAAEVGALPDTYTPPVDAALSEISTNPVQNKVVAAKLSEVESIAKGRATGYVFDTESDMRSWIASNASELNIGDNLYIRATDVPDYWWDGTSAQPLETQKIDLTEYAKKSEVPAVDTTLTQSSQAADAAEVGTRLSSLSEEIVTTSESKVSAHNTGADTHSDIRLLIQGLTDRLNALADSDDTTLDQLSEVVAYIKSNRTLIEAITTSKVSVADIIDNLTTNVTNKPLSAAQGVALKALIDAITIPEALPNPNALTFTGAVTGSYDGSSHLTVNIPSGGGGSSLPTPTEGDVGKVPVVQEDLSFGLRNMVGGDWEVISDLTLGEEAASVSFDIDVTYRRLWFIVYGVPASGTNSKLKIEFTKSSDQTKCIIEVNNGIQATNTTDGANKRPAQIYLEKINGYVPFALSAVNNGGNTPNAAMLSIGTDSFKVDWSDIYKVSFTALNTSFSSGSIFKLWGYK